jgi:hypothetical protein
MSKKANKREQAMKRKYQENQRGTTDFNDLMVNSPRIYFMPFIFGRLMNPWVRGVR